MDTRREIVRKTVGSVSFDDPYDWLQRDTSEALEWMWACDSEAQAAAKKWPGHFALKAAIASSTRSQDASPPITPRLVGGRWFWAAAGVASTLRALWTGEGPATDGRVLAEAAALAGLDDDPASLFVSWFEPSPDGEYVACSCTSRGAMVGWWRVVEVATRRVLELAEPSLMYTCALPGWQPDASGFWLADRVDDGRHRIRFVPVKTDVGPRDGRIFELSEIPANVSGLTVEVSPDGSKAIALAGPHERIAFMLGDLATGEWRRFLPERFEGECQGAWHGNDCYVARASDDDAPRGRIVAIPVASSRDPATWREIEPQQRRVLRAVGVVQQRIVVADVLDCSARFRVLDLDGGAEKVLPLEGPGTSMIAMLLRRFDGSDALCLDYASFVQPTVCYHYDLAADRLHVIGVPARQLDCIRVTQHFARSGDGVRVPYFLVRRVDLGENRSHPALITGYGGFNVALMPGYLGHVAVFVQAGGVYIHCNLRGGAEYGKQWHENGRLTCKWNVFADFFAVAEQVIADGVTTPAQFAMTGASNGGLLAGAAIVHRPDLWRAVVPVVPLFDMMEPLPREPQFDAMRAIFIEDYGAPADPVLGKVLYSYSPYHNVRAGTAYPAVYQVFGENDLGCMPFHGRKFTAALRAATTSGHPVHLRVWKNTGHGSADAATTLAQNAEWLGFVMEQLGMEFPTQDSM